MRFKIHDLRFTWNYSEQIEKSSLRRFLTYVQNDNTRKNERGITLIELIIYMGIFSTLLMVLVQLFGAIVNVNLESQANSAVSQDGRFILSRMSYDLRRAVATSFTKTDGSAFNYGTSNQVTGIKFVTIDGTTYKYWLSGGNLMLDNLSAVPTTSDQLNSYGTTVTNLTFTRFESTAAISPKNTIIVSFTLTSTTVESGNRTKVGNFQTTIGTR